VGGSRGVGKPLVRRIDQRPEATCLTRAVTRHNALDSGPEKTNKAWAAPDTKTAGTNFFRESESLMTVKPRTSHPEKLGNTTFPKVTLARSGWRERGRATASITEREENALGREYAERRQT